MKAYLTIRLRSDRIIGTGTTPDESRTDALKFTRTLAGTRTIFAVVDADTMGDIYAYTDFVEIYEERS